MQKLDAKAAGLAVGIVWSALVFLSAIMAMFGWAVDFVNVMGSVYIGYQATFFGAIVGAIWAFADGFLGGIIMVWLYNKFVK